jgi:hypothetical protein
LTDMPLVASIPGPRIAPPDWRAWLEDRFATSRLALGEQGWLFHADGPIAWYELMDAASGRDRFQSEEWFPFLDLSPWQGRVAAFLTWNHAPSAYLASEFLFPKLVELGALIAHLERADFRRTVRPMQFSLDGLLSKFGFEDGDAFVTQDEDYVMAVRDAMLSAIDASGLEGHITCFGGHHNPLRLTGDLLRDGQPVADAAASLGRMSVTFDRRDWSVLQDKEFWSL